MRHSVILFACLIATAWLQGCGRSTAELGAEQQQQQQQQVQKPTDVLLIVDGITITFGDLLAGTAFFDTLQSEVSRRNKMQRVLEDFTLPLMLARREFQKERAPLLEQALALSHVAGNVVELEARGKDLAGERRMVTPREVEIPIAIYLFDKEHIGGRSEPIELPQGFTVVGSRDLIEGKTTIGDRCDAVQVPFFTHNNRDWRDWLRKQQEAMSKKVTYFHPDFRDAIPPWLLP
jgi:hypothetical protein